MDDSDDDKDATANAKANVVPLFVSASSDTRASRDEDRASQRIRDQNSAAAPADARLDANDPMTFVRQFMARERLGGALRRLARSNGPTIESDYPGGAR